MILNKATKDNRRLVLWHVPWPLVHFDDLGTSFRILWDWCRQIGTETAVEIILSIIAGRTPDDAAEVWRLADNVPELKSALTALYSIQLDSPFAKYERERVASLNKPEGGTPVGWLETLNALVAASTSNISNWWRVDLALLEATADSARGKRVHARPNCDPSMESPESRLPTELVTLARRYLVEGSLEGTSWLGTETWYRPAAAAYRAFRLLSRDAADLASLPKEVWRKWAAAIVGFSSNGSNDELAIQATIGRLCRIEAPQEFVDCVRQVVAANYYRLAGPGATLRDLSAIYN